MWVFRVSWFRLWVHGLGSGLCWFRLSVFRAWGFWVWVRDLGYGVSDVGSGCLVFGVQDIS